MRFFAAPNLSRIPFPTLAHIQPFSTIMAKSVPTYRLSLEWTLPSGPIAVVLKDAVPVLTYDWSILIFSGTSMCSEIWVWLI